MSEFSSLLERIDRQCHLAAAAASGTGCAHEDVEALLSEGYLAALTGESRSRQLAARLEAVAQTLENEASATEVRKLALEKRTVDERVRVLRDRLGELRDQWTRLSDDRRPASR